MRLGKGEYRRIDILDAIGNKHRRGHRNLSVSPENALDRLLALFDEHEPETAALIRFGPKE